MGDEMSKIQTLNNKILVSNGAVLVYPESGGGNAQASKSYTVAASGAQTISPDTGYDSMQEVALSVPAGSAGTPSATKGTVSNHAVSVTPSVTNTTGWITGETKNGTAVSVSASELVSGTYSVTSSGTKDVTNYASASVPSGTATAPASISGTSASVSTGTNTLTLSKTVSVTPNVSTAGYISSGTAGNSSVSLTASVTTKAAATITPTTSNQTIASGTYLTGTQTIAGDANLVAGNIKKNVTIFNTTGTYEGSGGTLTSYTIRPDAELVKTWSYDAYAVDDWELTIPSYSTSAQTVKASAAATGTYTMDYNNYDYYVVQRMLSIPTYSITTKAKGRVEYWIGEYFYEIVSVPANTFHALITPTTYYTSRNTTVTTAGYTYRSLYWTSGSAISTYTNAVYSVVQTGVAPTNSSGVLTINTPNCTMRGSTTYFVNTFFNAITDIRYQWIAELYRAPKSNMNIDGWGFEQGLDHLIDCAQSSTGKLT